MAVEETEEEIEAREKLIEVLMEQARTGEKSIDGQIKLYLENTKFGKSLAETTKAANKVTSGFKESAKAMGQGTGSITDLSGAVTGTIDAISGLLGNIPIFGKGLEAMGSMASEIASFGIGQIQANYDSFKELAKAGTIGAEGVTGMADQFVKAGLPLQVYSKLLSENSENLAYFSGTALQGGRDFSKLMANMDKDSQMYMRNLGYGIDEIGEAAIEYQALQRRRGFTDQLTQAELAKGTADYVEELDALAKMTGMQVSDLKKQRDEVRADSRFRARLLKLRQQDNQKGADSMEMFAGMLNKLSPELRKGFSDITSGAINTEAALKMTRSGYLDTMQDIQAGLESGKMNHAEAINMIIATSKRVSEAGGTIQGLAGVSDEAAAKFVDLAKTADLGNMTQKELNKILTEQAKVKEDPDAATKALSSMMGSIEQTMANVNQLFIASPEATQVLGKFAEGLEVVIQKVSDWANAEEKAAGGTVGGRPVGTAMSLKEMQANKVTAAKRVTDTNKSNIETVLANLKDQGRTQAQIDEAMKPIYEAYGMEPPKPGEVKTPTAKPVKAAPTIAKSLPAPKPKMQIKPDVNIHDEIAKTTAMRDQQQAALQEYNKSAQEGGWTSAEKREQKEMRDELLGIKMQLVTLVDIAKKQKESLTSLDRTAKIK